MPQKLTSELVLKLTQQVSGPAAEARKALDGVDKALAAIGKQRAAQQSLADLSRAYEVARARVRDLQNQLVAAEKPSATLKRAYQSAAAAADGLGDKIARQRKAIADGARGLAAMGVAADGLAAAEARLKTQATAAGATLQKEAEIAARAARQRRSLTAEIVRSANEEAAANRARAAAEKAANDAATNSAAEAARRRRISLSKEMVRAANEEAHANRAAAEAARRAREVELRQAQERRAARTRAVVGAAEMAAPFVLGGAVRSVKGGAGLEHEVARSRAAGLSEDEIRENAALAAELSRRYPTVSQTSGMHALRNFRSVVGSAEEAAHIADPLMKMRYVVEAAHPGRIIEDDFDKLIKGLEIKGVTQDMGRFVDYIQGMTQALNTFGDTLRAADYYEMFKYGRQATQSLERDYMLLVAPTLAQELGGQGAGNAHASFHQGFIGGRLKASAIQQLEDFGLVGDESKIIRHPQNQRILGAQSGFLKESALAAKNPYRWVQEVMLPAITAKVGDDPEKIQEVIAGLASNRVASQFLAILATQQSRIEKDRHLVKNAPGLESYETYQKDPLVAWKGMVTQFDNLLSVASSPAVAQAAGAMQSIAAGLSSLAEVAKNHPILSGAAVGTAGVVGAVGTYKLAEGLFGGFGLRGSATALDASAAALTEAAIALGASSGLPGGPGKTKGKPSFAGRLAKYGSFGLMLAAALDFADAIPHPKALDATPGEALDKIKALMPGGPAPSRYIDPAVLEQARRAQDEFRRDPEGARGRAMMDLERRSSLGDPAATGATAGQALGGGIADGLGKQSSLVEDAARQILATVRAVFAEGVDLPVRLDRSNVRTAAVSTLAELDRRVEDVLRSTYSPLEIDT